MAEAEDHVTEPAAIPAAGGPAGAQPPLSRNHLVNQPELPLLGVLPAWRVIDLSQAISGPYAARILSDLGADVLRIEGPRTDVTEYFGVAAGQRSGMYSQMNAGKRSVGVDLAVTGAADLVRDLATRADVLIENFRPGVMERFGLGYEQLSAVNPALIMV